MFRELIVKFPYQTEYFITWEESVSVKPVSLRGLFVCGVNNRRTEIDEIMYICISTIKRVFINTFLHQQIHLTIVGKLAIIGWI